MVKAQEWLDKDHPKENRKQIKKLNIGWKELKGKLNLNDFTNLEKLDCHWNSLTSLNVGNCKKLKELYCSYNQITQLILPNNLEILHCRDNLLTDLDFKVLNGEKLTSLNLENNNFSARDLSCFSSFAELERLDIGTYNQDKINQNLYNRWTGSLEPLKDLNKLRKLAIDNTDLNEGIEYLPDGLKKIEYSTKARPNCKLTNLVLRLEKFNEYGQCQSCKRINTNKNWCQPCAEKESKQDLGHLTGQELIEKFINDFNLDTMNIQEEENSNQNVDWKNIHSNFAPELIQQWQSHNFTLLQCKEWLDVGLKITDTNYAQWLRDIKQLTPEQVLNCGNQEQLNQEFFTYWQEQQIHIEQPPK
jgi:hypothetical protein